MIKRALVVTALLVFFVNVSFVNVSAEPIKGSGAKSCGSWLKERRNGTYALDLNWILGFISAYNHYIDNESHSNGVFGSADPEAVAAWMDNYCGENPLSNPYTGSVKLIEELREKRRRVLSK